MRQFRARTVKNGSSYHGKKKGVKGLWAELSGQTRRH
jgi:hypothetical protein